jgi:hypothetical protein
MSAPGSGHRRPWRSALRPRVLRRRLSCRSRDRRRCVIIAASGMPPLHRHEPRLDARPAQRQGVEMTAGEIIADAMNQERPVLPAPHQVFAELWNTTDGRADPARTAGRVPAQSAQPLLPRLADAGADASGLRHRRAGGHPAGRGDRAQPGDGPVRHALGHRQPDDPDPRHRADDHRGAELHRAGGADPEIADLGLSQLLSRSWWAW